MIRIISSVLVLALVAGSIPAADPVRLAMPDIFGRPRLHGESVNKAAIGLYAGRTTLHFGQPMLVELFSIPVTLKGSFVYPRLDDSPNTTLELTDAAGKVVPFRREGGGIANLTDLKNSFTLWPTPAHAAGVYWKPGTYKLRATTTNPAELSANGVVPGTFKSNELTFTVREFGAALYTWGGKPALRELDTHWSNRPGDVFLFAAGLDDESSERLRKQTHYEKELWRAEVARYAPVTVAQDRKLSNEEAKKLLAGLKHADPDVRIRSVRSVPPIAPAEVLAAAVLILDDPHSVKVGEADDPVEVTPVPLAADDALGRFGPAVVDPLIAYAEKGGDERKMRVAALLGRTGPTESGEKFLTAAVRSSDGKLIPYAEAAATEWGKAGLGVMRAVLAEPKSSPAIRQSAVAAVGRHGDLKTDGLILRRLLGSTEKDVRCAVLKALEQLQDVESLPEFERIARDRMIDPHTRNAAVAAVLALTDLKVGDRLLLDLIRRKQDEMRASAIYVAVTRTPVVFLPLTLEALDDPDVDVRMAADTTLRAWAADPRGVGFDLRKPDAKLWRDYWAKRIIASAERILNLVGTKLWRDYWAKKEKK